MHVASAEPVDLLKGHLERLLRDLDEEIKTSYPVAAGDLLRRVAVAEVSAVYDLANLARQALVGDSLPADPRCIKATQALDLRDALAIAARDVRIERERVEAELSALQLLTWPQDFLAALQDHMAQEAAMCGAQEQAAQRGRQRAAALRAVAKDVSDVTLDCLACAARLPPGDAQPRRDLGVRALAQVEGAACGWLQWTAALDDVERRLQAGCAPLRIARLLTEVAAQDAKATAFLTTVRHVMKLRRQQLRLQGAQHRLAAVLVAGEALASLLARIRLV